MAAAKRTRKKKNFKFSCLGSKKKSELKYGDEGDDVRALQTFLTQAGYLRRDRAPGRMCHCTCDALQYFQKCYGLKDTGVGDEETLELIQQPRCGVPDIGVDRTIESGPAPFVLVGCQYNTNNLTYAFLNSTPDLPNGRDHEIIREAFGVWADVTPLQFTEVGADDAPTFPISFERQDHGDGSAFDEGGSINGNTLAHAFFPPPCGGIHAGALHFDEFENWTDQASPGRIRLLNVAIHEIGHNLGLRHSNIRDAIMFAFYSDDVDSLRQDDINGIQAIYGARPAGPAPIRGRLDGDGDTELHRIVTQPGRMRVTLFGPAGQDFDVYLRAGLPPTRTEFDVKGFGPTAEETIELTVSGGDVFLLVDSWRGSGAYEVLVEFL